jgi:hypothetical protein
MNYDRNMNSKSSQKKVHMGSTASGSKVTLQKSENEFKSISKNIQQRRKMYCFPKPSIEKVRAIETELLSPISIKSPKQSALFPKRKVFTRRSFIIKDDKEDIFMDSHYVRCRSLRNIGEKTYKYIINKRKLD